jgi:hypothetical protein
MIQMEIDELKELMEDESKLLDRINFLESERIKAYENRDRIKSKFKRFQELQAQPDKTLELQIIESAKKHKAYNPNQVFELLRNRFDKDGNTYFFPEINASGTIKKVPLDDHIKSFLDDPNNENLKLSDDINLGRVHRDSMKIGKRLIKYDMNDVKEADNLGLEIKDYLRIKKLREEKLRRK